MTDEIAPAASGVERTKLWDPFLRGFHWLLAVVVVGGWTLGEFGPDVMTLHFWCGYTVAGLLAFRVVWGFIGPRPARFTELISGPRTFWAYARHLFERHPSYWPGHNPMGALAVIAMLAILAAQIGTGLISDPDDFINVGPLASSVASEIRHAAVGWHHLGAIAVLGLIMLHIGFVLFYRLWKHEDLVRPMLSGWKLVRKNSDPH
jgi:cytochrome b